MKTKLIIFLLAFTQLISVRLYSQILYTENDTIQLDQETFVLQLDNYRGQIQWQYSDNGIEWDDLLNKNADELNLPIHGNKGYYRACIIEGSCSPVYSEIAKITYELPTVITNAASGIALNSINLNGEVIRDGGTSVTSRGFYWSKTNTDPGSGDNIENSGSGTGVFSASLSGLESNTTYYVRAFATNSEGTNIGDVISFTTSGNLPVVVTNAVTNITSESGTLNGEVSNDGGTSVTSRGFYWSKTNTDPGSGDNIENSGSGTGVFSASLSGLESNTTYYVRAFATNSEGTNIGDVVSFTTSGNLLLVVTKATTNITSESGTLNGEVTNDGGTSVTSRGFYWSKTNTDPGSGDNIENSGSGTGVFSASLSGLESNTTYYVRAFATNSEGTNVGIVVNFKTISGDLPKKPDWLNP